MSVWFFSFFDGGSKLARCFAKKQITKSSKIIHFTAEKWGIWIILLKNNIVFAIFEIGYCAPQAQAVQHLQSLFITPNTLLRAAGTSYPTFAIPQKISTDLKKSNDSRTRARRCYYGLVRVKRVCFGVAPSYQ